MANSNRIALRQTVRFQSLLLAILVPPLAGHSQIGEFAFDFDGPLPPGIQVIANHPELNRLQPSGGKDGGFLALAYPVNGLHTTLLFPDLDWGELIKAFTLEVDLRFGNSSSGSAGEGFSISLARDQDPIFCAPFDPSAFHNGKPQSGTTSGFSISFQTSPNAGYLTLRLDDGTTRTHAFPIHDAPCENPDSLQTGPRDPDYWLQDNAKARVTHPDSWRTLCWSPLFVRLDETAKLTVRYKSITIIENYQTGFSPSQFRLVLAAANGASNQHVHLDNLKLQTIPADKPLISLPGATPSGFKFPLRRLSTPIDPASLRFWYNGEPFAVTWSADGNSGTVQSDAIPLRPPGTRHELTAEFTAGCLVLRDIITWSTPGHTAFPASLKLTPPEPPPGFEVRVSDIDIIRGPGDPNLIVNGERQLAGLYVDAENNPLPNHASSDQFVVPVVNWSFGGWNGAFTENFNSFSPAGSPIPNQPIPGLLRANPKSVAAELFGLLYFPAGSHRLGVNSNDGFLLTLSGRFGPLIASFNGSRGIADTHNWIHVAESGYYPIRLSWWETDGGGVLEFFEILPDGTKALINSPASKIKFAAPQPATEYRLEIQRLGQALDITWNGGGFLEASPSLENPVWREIDSDGRHVTPPNSSQNFYRVRR